MNPDPMPRPTEDELIARYHEAAALDGASPSTDLRAAVLAQAEVTAWKHADAAENPDDHAIDEVAAGALPAGAEAEFAAELPLPAGAAVEAANDRRWFIPAVASIAVLGLATLLALQFDRSGPADRAVALGQRSGPPTDVAAPAAVPAPPESMASEVATPEAAPPSPEAAPESAVASATPAHEPTAPPPIAAPVEAPRKTAAPAPVPVKERAVEHPAPAAKPAPTPRAKPPAPAREDRATARRQAPAEAPSPRRAPAPAPAASSTESTAPAPTAAAPLPDTTGPQAPAGNAHRRPGPGGEFAAPDAAYEHDRGPLASADAPRASPRLQRPGPTMGMSADPADAAPNAEATRRPALTPSQRLLAAATQGQMTAAREALQQGAPANASDGSGRTALMLAARRGDVGMARLLTAAGADARRPDGHGLSAIDHARRAGHEALARHLEQGGGGTP